MMKQEFQLCTSKGGDRIEQSHVHTNSKSIRSFAAPLAACALLIIAIAGCSTATTDSAQGAAVPVVTVIDKPLETRAFGKRVKALDFAVKPAPNAVDSSPSIEPNPEPNAVPGSSTSLGAVKALISSAIARDFSAAWAHVSRADQQRIGYVQRLVEEFNAAGWTDFAVESSTLDTVTVKVKQVPKISEIDGVIAEHAIVRVKTIAEDGGYRVLWSKRTTEQIFPEMSAIENLAVQQSVTAWAKSRQACETQPSNQYSSGLVGVVGLADALCKTVGTPVIGEVQDLYGLDEPDPLFQAFGSSAASWARVVKISAPVAMSVVLAPTGKDWIVVAIARPSISES